ncbi:MAG: hypothetical protein QOJ42_5094, partial [Acidobacteriaceae bacterium]|nr:hypothetical protein [Acidobacteriaceae bacterium]
TIMSLRFFLFSAAVLSLTSVTASCQQANTAPGSVSIVQPGAPGHSNKTLTPETATAAPRKPSEADIRFMQGMIMHHSQAVEMTELLRTRSQDKEVQALGKRISISQTDEMRFMKQWLTDRGLPVSEHGSMDMAGIDMAGMDHMNHMDHMDMGAMPMMPGMLTPAQMKALAAATGPAFDHLFLTGMIQHHTGALTMVKDLFATQGAGQDPQLFDFASDVDNTQQAEIDIMRHMLKEKQ